VTTYRIAPDVAWHASQGRVAVLDLADASAVPFVLEGSASAIWNAVSESGGDGADGVVSSVAVLFGLSADDVRDDVVSFLEELVERALIEARDDGAGGSGHPEPVTGSSAPPL
jgi:hypothetical protein